MKFDDIIPDNIVSSKYTPEEARLIKKLYEINFKKPLNISCSNCISDAYFELRNLKKKNKLIEHMKSEYKLKPGAIIIKAKNGLIVFNRFSVTDELAEIALSENPGLIKYFESYPNDWEIRCGLKKKKEETIEKVENEITLEDEEIKKDFSEVEEIKEIEETQKKKRGRKKKQENK